MNSVRPTPDARLQPRERPLSQVAERPLSRVATRRRSPLYPPLGLAFILIAAAGLLFFRLDAFPLNNDEGGYILYSYLAAHPHHLPDLFGNFNFSEPPLYTWLGAVALRLHPARAAQLVTVRSVSVLCGVGTVAAVYALARQLYRDVATGLLAAVLYAFCPFAVLYNRLAFLDSLAQLIGVLVAIQCVRVYRRKDGREAPILQIVLLGILLGQLVKGTAFFFWLLPLLGWYALAPARTAFQLKRTLAIMTPVALAVYSVVLASGSLRDFFRPLFLIINHSAAAPRSPVHFDYDHTPFPLWSYAVHNAAQWLSWQQHYVGYGPVVALVVAFYIGVVSRKHEDGFLALWLAIPLVAMLFTKVYNSRYIVFTVPIEMLCVSRGVVALVRHARRSPRGRAAAIPVLRGTVARMAAGAVYALLVLGGVYTARFDATRDATLVSDPIHGDYDSFDQWYFITGWLSGYGFDNVTAYIRRQAQTRDVTVVADEAFLPLVSLRYSLADNPRVHIQSSSGVAGLPLASSATAARPLTLAVLDVPKDDLAAVETTHPTWKVVMVQNKPLGQSQFVVLSSAT